jgi:hypothetical protein
MKKQTVEKKIKVLYEASILNQFDFNTSSRTGIYWTAYNLLKQLSIKPNIEIYLYSDNPEKTLKFI